MKKILPVDFIPEGSRLIFIKQTISSAGNYQRRKKGEKRICSKALYLCICGAIIEKNVELVKYGHTKSCGCLSKEMAANRKRTHGLSEHPLHGIWHHIKGRCYTETDYKYPYYGAIGVRMCDEWRYDFMKFYDWCMAHGWKSGLQIDKDIKAREFNIVPGMLYSPEWCSVVTGKENANSKRNNRFLLLNGELKTVAQWAEIYGVSSSRIIQRINNLGWTVEKAITTKPYASEPKKVIKGKFITYNGETKNIKDWALSFNLGPKTLWNRLNIGWSIEKALYTPTNNTGKKK